MSALAPFVLSALLAGGVSQELDTFMEKVLERREINWADYEDYFCRESAVLAVEGALASVAIQGTRREYLWSVRDDVMVRSPISVDGVPVSAEDREDAERDWIRQANERREREADPGDAERERFLGFPFEPGRYFFAGRGELEGREVVIIEYYPEDAFGGDDDDEDDDAELEAKLNKVLLVTLWIDPEEHQIVRMTLDNAGFDFLPAKWLVQLDTVEASMTMHQPFVPANDVWLPRDILAHGRITTAAGDLGLQYESTFHDCVRADTSSTFQFTPPGDPAGKSRTKKKR